MLLLDKEYNKSQIYQEDYNSINIKLEISKLLKDKMKS